MLERFNPDITSSNPCWEAFQRHHQGLYALAGKFLREQRLRRDALIVDAACGTGYGHDWLGFMGNYLGIDIDEKAVSYCRRTRPAGAFIVHDLDSWECFNNLRGVDVLCSFETAEHLKDPVAFLKRAAGVVRHGGYLLFSAPTCKTMDFDPFHRRDWSSKEWESVLTRCGWRVVEQHRFAFSTTFRSFRKVVPTSFWQKMGIVVRGARNRYLLTRFWEWIICGRFRWESTWFACERS